VDYNYSYYPVIFPSEGSLLGVKTALNAEHIFPRRYFYPALSTLCFINDKQKMAVAEAVAPRILCLPLYHDLPDTSAERIAQIIMDNL
jgi:dTDP-4-amino-4,6-dideoxygalactose transaminase